MGIDIADLEHWADDPDSRALFPVLVRRVIREIAPALQKAEFSIGDYAHHEGFDGETNAGSESGPIPEGITLWELGTGKRPGNKATSDYKKRTEACLSCMPSSTFAFISLRSWPNKESWCRKRQKQRKWKDVRAFDADDLECWLNDGWISQVWLSELLGHKSSGFQSPCAWWEEWASATDPSLPTALAVARRGDPDSQLMKLLQDPNCHSITISSESREETIAFVIATLIESKQWSVLDRAVVLRTPSPNWPSGNAIRRIIIADVDDHVNLTLDPRQYLTIRHIHHSFGMQQPTIRLPYIYSADFYRELGRTDLSQTEAVERTYRSGCSLSAYRRLNARDGRIQQPDWARTAEFRECLLALFLAGSWAMPDTTDWQTISNLADKPEAELEEALHWVLHLDDSPIVQYGSMFSVVSQVDVLHALGGSIEEGLLTRYFSMVKTLLSEADPTWRLPPDERYRAPLMGVTKSHSDELVRGTANSLRLLSVYGSDICRKSISVSLSDRIHRVVLELMSDPTEENWYTMRHHMMVFAECNPDAFLVGLETDLQQEQPGVAAIMRTASETYSDECLRCNLLWALEMLSQQPEFFERTALVLLKLRKLESDDLFAHKAQSSLKAVFHPRQLALDISADVMIHSLEVLAKHDRVAATDICLTILSGQIGQYTMDNAPFYWPAADQYDNDRIAEQYSLVQLFAEASVASLSGLHAEEILLLVDNIEHVKVESRLDIVNQILQSCRGLDDNALAHIQHRIDGRIYLLHMAGKAPSARETLWRLAREIVPEEPAFRYDWLFRIGAASPVRLAIHMGLDDLSLVDEEGEIVLELRLEIMSALIADGNPQAVVDFAVAVPHPIVAGEVMAILHSHYCDLLDLVDRTMSASDTNNADLFLRGFFGRLPEQMAVGLVRQYMQSAIAHRSHRLIAVLPASPVFWEAAGAFGEDMKRAYWTSVAIHSSDVSADTVEYCVRCLISSQRGRLAFTIGRCHLRTVSAITWKNILWCIVSESRSAEKQWVYGVDRDSLSPILTLLEGSPDCSDTELINIECAFLNELSRPGHSEQSIRRALLIHRRMAANSHTFVSVLRQAYYRGDHGNASGSMNRNNDENDVAARMVAKKLLSTWNLIPGIHLDGTLDQDMFNEWVSASRAMASDIGLKCEADRDIGRIYARILFESTSGLPSKWVCDSLEQSDAQIMRKSYVEYLWCTHGTSIREAIHGGATERGLAQKFRGISNNLKQTHPKLASCFEEAVHVLEGFGQGIDDMVAMDDRW